MGTVFRRKHPGEQRHLRRQAPAARRNGLFVDHTFGSQGIDMWRCGAGVAIAGKALRPGGIQQQKNDVRRMWHQAIVPITGRYTPAQSASARCRPWPPGDPPRGAECTAAAPDTGWYQPASAYPIRPGSLIIAYSLDLQ